MKPFHLYLYGPSRGPLQSSFEQAEQRLTALPMLHFEPDGSFVWSLEGGKQQVFGMVYDAGGRIQYCDLRGQCRYETWKVLCEAVSGPSSGELEILVLPNQQLQDLHSFEASQWPESAASTSKNS